MRPVRARFIADCGWASYERVIAEFTERDAALAHFREQDETVLWFEPDLYDQLQLLQVLDWFAGQRHDDVRLSIVPADSYLGPATDQRINNLFSARQPLKPELLTLGRTAWEAFTSADPRAILDLLRGDTAALPYLAGALRRHLQQFPSRRNGLARSEQRALAALLEGPRTPAAAFTAAQSGEEYLFLGDTAFGWYLQRLGLPAHPLVAWSDGEPLPAPPDPIPQEEFLERVVALTELGHEVLTARADWVTTAGIDRWLGGVHLTTRACWRWDETEELRLVS
jgi:hypothetical protein